MSLIYATPWWLSIAVVLSIFVSVACGGHIVVRRSFPKVDFIEHNDVAGFIIAVVGVIYAVLLAFLTIVVWEQFAEADNRAIAEVDAATDVYRFAGRLAEPDHGRLKGDVLGFSQAVAFDEWPKMKRGLSSERAQSYMLRLFDDASSMHVATLRESNLQNKVLERVQVLADQRRRRITSNRSGVPAVLWLALVAGAVTVIGFEYLFGLKNFTVQLLMTAATAVVIALSFGVIIELDFPFRGDIAISPERWIGLYEEISAAR